MVISAVLDANVLYPARLRDLLIRLAIAGRYRAHWTDEILDECFRRILDDRPDLSAEALRRTRRLMNTAIADVRIRGYEHVVAQIELPDPEDRHVLAVAIVVRADLIVTWNLSDFPDHALRTQAIGALSPDDFVVRLIEADADAVREVVEQQAVALRNPVMTGEQLLDGLAEIGLQRSVAMLRAETKEPTAAVPRRACSVCGEPVERAGPDDDDSWMHTDDARDDGTHTAEVR